MNEVIDIFLNLQFVVQISAKLAAIGSIIITLQWLANHSVFHEEGVLSWNSFRPYSRFKHIQRAQVIFDILLSYKGMITLLLIRLISGGVLLFVSFENCLQNYSLGVIFFSLLLVSYRNTPYGINGGDRMLTTVIGSLWLLKLSSDSIIAQTSCLFFIAAQVSLGYFTSGMVKMTTKWWNKEEGSNLIFHIPYLVAPKFRPSKRIHSILILYLDRLIFFWQLTFVLAIFISPSIVIVYLFIGIGFHSFNAVILGFNTFVFPWLSSYPAVLYCAIQLRACWGIY